ncbi:unnamed protein product, partial [Prorocentrum cordatum]
PFRRGPCAGEPGDPPCGGGGRRDVRRRRRRGGRRPAAQQAAAMAQMQQLLESQKTLARRGLTSKCFDACVSSPGKALFDSQQVCVWRCAQRYMETQHFIKTRMDDKIESGTWKPPTVDLQ